jgi:hypothetical protein
MKSRRGMVRSGFFVSLLIGGSNPPRVGKQLSKEIQSNKAVF